MFGACLNEKEPIPKKAVSLCDSIVHYKVASAGYVTVDSIIQLNCATPHCHNASSIYGDFTTYQGLKIEVDNNKLREYAVQYITDPMPASAPLTAVEIKVIDCWIKQGAQNN